MPPSELSRAIHTSTSTLRALTSRLAHGEIDLAQWQRESAAELSLLHTYAGTLAFGGPANVNDAIAARLQNHAAAQINRVWSLAGGISRGEVTNGQAMARIPEFARAANATFENSRRESQAPTGWERRVLGHGETCPECVEQAARGWVPFGTLPCIGHDASCDFNCACAFEYAAEAHPPALAEFTDIEELRDLVEENGGDPDEMTEEEMEAFLEEMGVDFGGVGSGRYPKGSGKKAQLVEQKAQAVEVAKENVKSAVKAHMSEFKEPLDQASGALRDAFNERYYGTETNKSTEDLKQAHEQALSHYQANQAVARDHWRDTVTPLIQEHNKAIEGLHEAIRSQGKKPSKTWSGAGAFDLHAHVSKYVDKHLRIKDNEDTSPHQNHSPWHANFGGEGSGRYPKGSGARPNEHEGSKIGTAPPEQLNDKAARAKAYYKPSDAEKQQYAEGQEGVLTTRIIKEAAKKGLKLSIHNLPDNEPADIEIRDAATGKLLHAVEVKTLVDNKNAKITVHSKKGDTEGEASSAKKVNYVLDKLGGDATKFHTIALDKQKDFKGGANKGQYSGHEIHYKRGTGAFRLKSMYKASSVKDVLEHILKEHDDLPKEAKAPGTFVKKITRAQEARDKAKSKAKKAKK